MRVPWLLFVLCLCGFSLLASAQKSAEEVKILGLEKKWTDAYKQHSINSVTSLLAEDFTITIEDGRTFGKIGYIAHTADSSVQVIVAEQSDMKVRLRGNMAVVTGGYHEQGSSNGRPYDYHDRFTDVWIKNDAQWQLVASHYSVPVQP
jgi:ketosteroid isomerase-like protein